MAEEDAAHHLLNVLEEREINVDLDNVLSAFEDESSKAEVASWVNDYLHEDTLLTKEELELYRSLKKKGVLHQYQTEGEPIRPILDHELVSAIDSLQSSTAAIEEQCKLLEAQREALIALKALDKPNLSVEHMRNERRRKEQQEKARLDIAVDDISTSITEQLAETQKEVDSEKTALKYYLAERMNSDDQILSRLPAIASQIITQLENSDEETSTDQWCKAVISFRTAEIKARVDTVYLKSLTSPSSEQAPDAPDAQLQERKIALQKELEDLHSEIASVAEMVVEHELRKPITEIKERKDRDRKQAQNAWMNYVLSTLDYMGKRLDTVTSDIKNVTEFQQALTHIGDAASQRMPNPHVETGIPSRKRAPSAAKSAFTFTPAIKLKPPKTLDLPLALQDALRHAGISFSQDSVGALRESLAKTQLEREKKLQDHYTSAAASTHGILAERFSEADVDVRIISDVLFSHTAFNRVSLTNPRVEEDMKMLERELESADQKLLAAEADELSLSDPRVRAFINKYGK
ncbi:hypothetical protein BDV95DRAFT_481501 [Massariosphaeria phaeospora]|uniref:Uncharacterized protein n=1 Tax=Massariosphaeria phaeospora TaxID=100035 RepID=A0A7C8IET1_9PLEO|nr:hypothetical protein BDV95DRAFT_481501 [Massariosphaeria phaeospora]